jgi:hypothetical protein
MSTENLLLWLFDELELESLLAVGMLRLLLLELGLLRICCLICCKWSACCCCCCCWHGSQPRRGGP